MVPQSELDQRISLLQKALIESGTDAALILQHADLFYYSGAVNRTCLFVPAVGLAVLFVLPGAERIREESAFPLVEELLRFDQLPDMLSQLGYQVPAALGLENDVLPVANQAKVRKLFPSSRLIDVSPLIKRQRMIKSAWEIEQIRSACEMGQNVFQFVPEVLRQQMSELEVAGEIDRFIRPLGHPGYMRVRGFNQELTPVLVISGPESSLPSFSSGPLGGRGLGPAFPHAATNRLIGKNEPVVVDFSAWSGGYLADMTRTYCIGNLPGHMEHAYDTALEIQLLLQREAKAGAICSELWTAVRQLVRTNGLCEHFMGMSRRVPFIAHGLGIEIDELPIVGPNQDVILQKNMVVAVEPKFVFPDGAVGLENTFAVGDRGLIPLNTGTDSVYYILEH